MNNDSRNSPKKGKKEQNLKHSPTKKFSEEASPYKNNLNNERPEGDLERRRMHFEQSQRQIRRKQTLAQEKLNSMGLSNRVVHKVIGKWKGLVKSHKKENPKPKFKNITQARNKDEIMVSMVVNNTQKLKKRGYTNEMQLLRSAGPWSLGLKGQHKERSIYHAYIELIEHSKKFIYIENQFFISASRNTKECVVKNRIGEAIANRIRKAIINKEQFFVCVILPLLPGFEARLEEEAGSFAKVQLGFEYDTICRSKFSIYAK